MDPNLDGAATMKLGALQQRFADFERQMEDETAKRRDGEDTKLVIIRETLGKLEKTLNSEIKRRVEANKVGRVFCVGVVRHEYDPRASSMWCIMLPMHIVLQEQCMLLFPAE